jgi:hypothetical protein
LSIVDLLLLRLFPRARAGKDKHVQAFESEDEVFQFCDDIYRETGGATPELRRAYDFYLKNSDAKRPVASELS